MMSLEHFREFLFWPSLLLVTVNLARNEAWVVQRTLSSLRWCVAVFSTYKEYCKIFKFFSLLLFQLAHRESSYYYFLACIWNHLAKRLKYITTEGPQLFSQKYKSWMLDWVLDMPLRWCRVHNLKEMFLIRFLTCRLLLFYPIHTEFSLLLFLRILVFIFLVSLSVRRRFVKIDTQIYILLYLYIYIYLVNRILKILT